MTALDGNVAVLIQDDPMSVWVGEIQPFDQQPPGEPTEGILCGIPVRFTWRFHRMIGVCVETQADADRLLAALAPK